MRNVKLAAWLDKFGACPLANVPGPNGSELQFYALAGRTLIVQMFADGNGWEIYVPPTRDNSVAATLEAALRLLGVSA
jgi:hypothetical protein